jgi:hypothetical protein
MRKTHAIFILAAVLATSSCVGCTSSENSSSDTEVASQEQTNNEDAISGEVTSISDSEITIEKDDGEELTFTVNADTEVVSESMQAGGDTQTQSEKPDGDSSNQESSDTSSDSSDSNQTPPEKPDGDSGNQESSDTSSDSSDSNQTPPEKPDGDSSNQESSDASSDSSDSSKTPPEKPDGDSNNQESSDASSDSSDSSQTPPEKPDGDSGEQESADSSDSSQTPPEKPDGDSGEQESADSGDSSQTPPEKPDGDSDGQTPPDMQNGEGGMGAQNEELSIDDISVGDTISVVLDDDNIALTITLSFGGEGMADMNGATPGGGMGNAGGSEKPEEYTAVNTYTEDTELTGDTISSTGTDENAVLVENGASVSLDSVTIDRTSSDSTGGDNSSFYGVGAATLVTDGTAYVNNSTITTDAAGGAGLFSYGDGTIYAADTTITTSQDTSGGVHVAGGGTLYGWNLNVTTSGGSAAAIRSDRGSGTMVIDGGTYTSNGVGSPAVYSTADISVKDADLTANSSEAVCIEGLNSLKLFDCDLSGNMGDDEQNDCTWTVIVYQSMSGDSEIGNGDFEMSGGTLTSGNGGVFYTTNTECTFTLNNVDIKTSDTNAFFLRCTGNNNQRGWGTTGSNGSDCLFTAINQDMTGDIVWDTISQLDFYMTENSSLTGAFVNDESYAGEGGSGYANLYIGEGSTWTVTGDSTLSALYTKGTIVDEDGNTVSVVGTDGTEYVKGDSKYTITVSEYSEDVDLSGASTISSWDDSEVDRPENL